MDFVALTTIAEVGAALAGFAALAGVLKSGAFDSDSIFDVVVNSLIALVFSLLALRFGETSGGVRILATALALASSVALARSLRVGWAAYHAYRDEMITYDLSSRIIWFGASLSMLLVPPVSILVAADFLPARARLLYETALLSHLLAAALLLLDVVRRNFAIGGNPPAA